uniref:Uncharacterized protein n=2 Tax=Staphylococcus TaxID=1279 RepID=A0A1Z1UZ10_STAEP|nr:Hypothetical protein [Staphylococcus epidermidis]
MFLIVEDKGVYMPFMKCVRVVSIRMKDFVGKRTKSDILIRKDIICHFLDRFTFPFFVLWQIE